MAKRKDNDTRPLNLGHIDKFLESAGTEPGDRRPAGGEPPKPAASQPEEKPADPAGKGAPPPAEKTAGRKTIEWALAISDDGMTATVAAVPPEAVKSLPPLIAD